MKHATSPAEDSPETALELVRWLGPTEGLEFGPCYQLALESMPVVTDLDEPADLTVIACPRPILDPTPITELASAGECVQLLGGWCEGEGRTGVVVPGVERVFWHAWPSWWRTRLGGQQETPINGAVWVQTPDAALADSLIDALAAESISATWAPAERLVCGSPGVILWDGAQLGGREATRLAVVCEAARRTETPVVVLLDFPRVETVAAAEAIGAAAVVGKPFERTLLFETLRDVAATSNQSATGSRMVAATHTETDFHAIVRAA